jgi:hypothetical protein
MLVVATSIFSQEKPKGPSKSPMLTNTMGAVIKERSAALEKMPKNKIIIAANIIS